MHHYIYFKERKENKITSTSLQLFGYNRDALIYVVHFLPNSVYG